MLPNTANVAAGGLVFGQFIRDRLFSVWLLAAGTIFWLVLLAVTLELARRKA